MATIRFRGSRDDLTRLIRALVAAITGGGPDPLGVARPVLTRGAVALLSKVQGAFVAKARGGTGDDGIQWTPLSRKTIAARRTTATELRSLGVGGRRVRGLLTPAEDARWRAIYRSTLASLRARGVGGAEALAAQRAWAILKAEGAKTKLEVLGGRTVEILRDTGALFRSLTPGTEEFPAIPPDQIHEVVPGRVTVGTNVPYAKAHHEGIPGRLPARPLWPATLPDAWWDAVTAAVARGIIQVVARAIEEGGRGS